MRFGHSSSMVMKNPDHPVVYLPILKNAHRYTSYVFQSFNFERQYPTDRDEYVSRGLKKLVVLRDPIDRWYSGIIQFMTAQRKLDQEFDIEIDFTNRDLCRLLTSVIVIDTHTRPQVNYLDGIDTDECIFLKFDSDLEDNLQYFCHTNFGGRFDPKLLEKRSISPAFKNIGGKIKSESRNTIMSKLKENISDYGYEKRLLEYYKEDIELYNSVNFLKIPNKGEKND